MPRKYSLYIPCYNAGKTLKATLSSVEAQTHLFDEVIVVDDGSTDDTATIAERYNVTLVRHQENQGLASARNTGVKSCKHEFVASIDSDVSLAKDWLFQIDKYFSAERFAGISGKLIEEGQDIFSKWRSVNMKQHWGESARFVPFMYGATSVFRKSALSDVGFYDEQYLTNYEDYDICRRLRDKEFKFFYVPYAVASHTKDDNLYSLLKSFWNWQFYYYSEKNIYNSSSELEFKLKENIGLSNRLMRKSLSSKNHELLYLDFLLGIFLSIRDILHLLKKDIVKGEDDWLFVLDGVLNIKNILGKDVVSLLDKKFDSNIFVIRLILLISVIIKQELLAGKGLIDSFIEDIYRAVTGEGLTKAAKHMLASFASSNTDVEKILTEDKEYLYPFLEGQQNFILNLKICYNALGADFSELNSVFLNSCTNIKK